MRASRSRRRAGARRAARRRRGPRARAARRRRAVAHRAGDTVVADPELDRVAVVGHAHRRAARARVADDVDQRLLEDPEGGSVDARRERALVALDLQLDAQPSRLDARDQGAEPRERRLWRQRELLVAAPQYAEQPAQLVERLAPGHLDGGDRAARPLGIARGGAPRGLGLHEHDRHVVGDDVVQLARDPRALLEDGRALALRAVALDLGRLHVQAVVELVARAQHAAADGRDAEGDERQPRGVAEQAAAVVLELGDHEQQHERRAEPDREVAPIRAQREREDIGHEQQPDEDGRAEHAPAERALGQCQRVEGEQRGERPAPGDDERGGQRDREDDGDPAAARVGGQRDLGGVGHAEHHRDHRQDPVRREGAQARVDAGATAHLAPDGRAGLDGLSSSSGMTAQCGSSPVAAGGRDSSASEVIASAPRAASSSTSVASSAERA